MPVLPSTLALTNIADGALAVAADHRGNYSLIQSAFNTLLGELDDGTAGDVLTGVGTTILWAKPPGYELDYAQITADVTVSGVVGAQTTVITGGAVTYDGTTGIVIEVMLVGVLNGATDSVVLELWDGGTSIGASPAINTAGSGTQVEWPVTVKKRLTPSAGAHTYTLKAYRTAANGTIKAGTGAAGAVLPSFMRITKV